MTSISFFSPLRITVSFTVSPAEYWRTKPVSAAGWFVVLPSIAVMTSPTWTPALAAGESG